jgi:hypothetical protein
LEEGYLARQCRCNPVHGKVAGLIAARRSPVHIKVAAWDLTATRRSPVRGKVAGLQRKIRGLGASNLLRWWQSSQVGNGPEREVLRWHCGRRLGELDLSNVALLVLRLDGNVFLLREVQSGDLGPRVSRTERRSWTKGCRGDLGLMVWR